MKKSDKIRSILLFITAIIFICLGVCTSILGIIFGFELVEWPIVEVFLIITLCFFVLLILQAMSFSNDPTMD